MNMDIQHLSGHITILFSILGRDLTYLDPGSGSYFIQLLLASLMGGLFILGVYRKKVTDFFRNLFSNRQDDEEQDE
jgi:hypothetical protein